MLLSEMPELQRAVSAKCQGRSTAAIEVERGRVAGQAAPAPNAHQLARWLQQEDNFLPIIAGTDREPERAMLLDDGKKPH